MHSLQCGRISNINIKKKKRRVKKKILISKNVICNRGAPHHHLSFRLAGEIKI